MANVATLLKTTNYAIAYTSEPYTCNQGHTKHPRGMIHVESTAVNVTLEGRLAPEAPWVAIKTYNANTLEAIDLPYQLRVITEGAAKVWIGEIY